jgi:hypothetical protein
VVYKDLILPVCNGLERFISKSAMLFKGFHFPSLQWFKMVCGLQQFKKGLLRQSAAV